MSSSWTTSWNCRCGTTSTWFSPTIPTFRFSACQLRLPRNEILRQYSIFDPFLLASFNAARNETPTNDVLAGAATLNTLNQPVQVRAQQLLPTGTIWNFAFQRAKILDEQRVFELTIRRLLRAQSFGFTQPLLRGRRNGIYEAADHDRAEPASPERVQH